ncbi:MAG: TIGR02221 family CRISPR-associated protein [Sphingobacteriia bacterium]|nr:TIGR02221 family CRISPR-associated protein [Sphingobacteriia bacterium]
MTKISSTMVSFLGRAQQDPQTGYKLANYRFPDGSLRTTPFFGLALLDEVQPERLVLLGTSGSMWSVLVEELATEGEEEDLRIRLIEAAAKNTVDRALLDAVAPLVERALGLPCTLRLIDYGKDAAGQAGILEAIADSVPKGRVIVDLTHGFRHLAAIGLLSAFFLERVKGVEIEGVYYGALDMTEKNETPVVRLDGLLAISRWIDALSRFDQNGDYSLFAPLLRADGVPADKAQCLEDAAFFERTLNLSDASRRIQTFLPILEERLQGASGLFQDALQKRLSWVRGLGLKAHQTRLANFYLDQGDYIRAAILGYEAVVTRECERRAFDPHDYKCGRKPAREDFELEIKDRKHPEVISESYWLLTNVRNALAHGTPPEKENQRQIVSNPERLPHALRRALDRLLT